MENKKSKGENRKYKELDEGVVERNSMNEGNKVGG